MTKIRAYQTTLTTDDVCPLVYRYLYQLMNTSAVAQFSFGGKNVTFTYNFKGLR